MQSCLRDIRVGYSHCTAHATAVARIQFYIIQIINSFVVDLLQNADAIFDTVGRQVAVIERSGCFTAGGCPSDANHTGLREGGRLYVGLHNIQEAEIGVSHGNHVIDQSFLAGKAVFNVTYLCGTRRDEEYADVLRGQLGMLLQRLLARQLGGNIHRREKRDNVVTKERIVHTDDPHYCGTGGTDHGLRHIRIIQIQAGVCRYDLRGSGYLKDVVKANGQ